MGSLYAKNVCDAALAEVGYVGGYHTSKYSQALDACNYWQMGAKDGSADWCSIFVNYCAYVSTLDENQQPRPDKYDAHYFFFEPDSGENLAAGCVYAANYFKRAGAWSDNLQGAKCGSQVFFRNYAHTGLVVDWGEDSRGWWVDVVEGNTTIDGVKYCVGLKRYYDGDPNIDGYGNPRYDGYELATAPQDENTQAKPAEPAQGTPEPAQPAPKAERYKVTTNGGVLRLRSAPNISSAYLIGIPNGTELDVSEIVNGEWINDNDEWARTTYGGYLGYVSCAWLIKI